MKKILFCLSDNEDDLIVWYSLLTKLGKVIPVKKNNQINNINTNSLPKKDRKLLNNLYLKIIFNDYELHLVQEKEMYNLNIEYDKSFILLTQTTFKKDNKIYKDDLINKVSSVSSDLDFVYCSFDENLVKAEDFEVDIKSKKIVTSTLSRKYPFYNIFSDYKLSFLFFYYFLGYYFLNDEKMNVEKQNLVGFYNIFDYIEDRDRITNKIISKFVNNTNLYRNYTKSYENDWSIYHSLIDKNGWFKNTISTYTDFIKSCVCFISESDHPNGDNSNNNISRCTEKTFKGLFFSKFNIPCILYVDELSIENLYNDGFWFFNFEFIDFKKFKYLKTVERNNIIEKSIENSIDYLLGLYKKMGSINLVNTFIQEKFENKMNNNSSLIDNILHSDELSKKVFNYLIKG